MAAPSQAVLDAIITAPVTTVTSRATIYESDGVTPFIVNAPFSQGTVNVDFGRDERRTLDITFLNVGGTIRHPDRFNYDKIVKVWRGVELPDGTQWEAPLGTFYIDTIKSQDFPHNVTVTLRDGTKKLLQDKFAQSTTFTSGRAPESIIRALALNGGITLVNLPPTGLLTTRDHAFERGVSRWEAVKEIANAYNFDVYFDADGYLVMTPFQDPATTAEVFTFKTGEDGTIGAFDKKTSDARIYNHIVVTGTGATPSVFAEAENNNPASPTSIDKIGRRTYFFESQFMYTTAQCQAVADSFLKIHALEDYEVGISSLVLPWLEAGFVVRFIDPDAGPSEPDRFLLTDFNIPLKVGSMDSSAKRVVML